MPLHRLQALPSFAPADWPEFQDSQAIAFPIQDELPPCGTTPEGSPCAPQAETDDRNSSNVQQPVATRIPCHYGNPAHASPAPTRQLTRQPTLYREWETQCFDCFPPCHTDPLDRRFQSKYLLRIGLPRRSSGDYSDSITHPQTRSTRHGTHAHHSSFDVFNPVTAAACLHQPFSRVGVPHPLPSRPLYPKPGCRDLRSDLKPPQKGAPHTGHASRRHCEPLSVRCLHAAPVRWANHSCSMGVWLQPVHAPDLAGDFVLGNQHIGRCAQSAPQRSRIHARVRQEIQPTQSRKVLNGRLITYLHDKP